jgi:hypothetical protein
MKTRHVFAGVVLASALAVGCEQKPEATPSPRRTTDTTTPTPNNTQARAQTLIDQCNQHIRNNEFDAAEANLRELDAMKSDLPQSLQNQISQLHTRLDNLKSTSPMGTRSPSTTTPPANPPSSTNPPVNPPPSEPPGRQ